jgi:[protein-PII] uridylyltransferase
MTTGRDSVFDENAFDRLLAAGADPLPHFRTALKQGRETLRGRYFDKPSDTPRLVGEHAHFIDRLLIRAWRLHLERTPPAGPAALVAVGGYGRGELHPASDIDLLLLFDKVGPDATRAFVERLLRFLWDIGLEVGHSVRTVKDCAAEAKKDVTVATNLMETRLLAGAEKLFAGMRAQTSAARIWPGRKFFAAKLAEQNARHRRYDDSAYNLEPNVKEGPGGLRDIQTIAWVTQRHFDTASLRELVERGFLREDELRTLLRGRHFLWKVRDGLHHLAGRREDRLLFDHQRALAALFGYRDRPGALAVEQFMKRYYRTIKELQLLNTILLQHFEEEILSGGRVSVKPINRRFRSRAGYLEVTGPRVFERAPFALLELFLILQQHGSLKGVRADTIRRVRANLRRINAKFRKDLGCRSLFMEILRQPRGLTHELRRMNAYGVLGAYLPMFGRIVGQMQHDLFHVYTVDQHTLFVVRNLRRLTVPEYRHEFPLASRLIQGLVKPERLYLAGLFHDIAKGRGGDHSALGAHEAETFCRHHHLSEYDARFVSWLVRHHLLMSATAQRQDISDPEVVLRFAQQVGDQEHLDNLYLLTVADMRGTSPAVWNAWKDRLLAQLYSATARVLARGVATPLDLEAHIADLRRDALARLASDGVPETAVQRFWGDLDAGYFLQYDAGDLAWQARVIVSSSPAEGPVVATRSDAEIGGSEFMFYTPDRDDLFMILTGGFDRLNLSIVEARIHTLKSGVALDTFVVLDGNGQAIADPRELRRLEKAMREQLANPQPGREPGSTRLSRQRLHFPIETRVNFGPAPHKSQTIMEVSAQDRPGLLYQVAAALKHTGVNLVAAKISTYGERAEDVFFINSREGHLPITDPAHCRRIEAEIVRRLAPSGTPAALSPSVNEPRSLDA